MPVAFCSPFSNSPIYQEDDYYRKSFIVFLQKSSNFQVTVTSDTHIFIFYRNVTCQTNKSKRHENFRWVQITHSTIARYVYMWTALPNPVYIDTYKKTNSTPMNFYIFMCFQFWHSFINYHISQFHRNVISFFDIHSKYRVVCDRY